MPTHGYHYIQRRQNITSFDSYGFPTFGPPSVKYVGCDKKRRFITKADRTEVWLCGPLRCSLITTFISPWYDTPVITKEVQGHARTQQQDNGATRTDTKAEGNGNGRRFGIVS